MNESANITTLTGSIQRIIFQNETNSFTIFSLKDNASKQVFVVVGTFTSINIGEQITCHGKMENDKKYGWRFKAESYHIEMPKSEDGILAYLSSGLIQGIGKKYAEKIVAAFGKKALEIIEKYPTRLLEVEGIGKQRLERVRKSVLENKSIQDIMIALQERGISAAYALKIYNVYKDKTVSVLQKNPYQLSDDVFGIGFTLADRIAQKGGIVPDAPIRIQAFITHLFKEIAAEGHCFYPKDLLLERAEQALQIHATPIQNAVEHLISQKKLVQEAHSNLNTNVLFPSMLHYQEQWIAQSLTERVKRRSTSSTFLSIKEILHHIEEDMKIQLAEFQVKALDAVYQNNTVIVTGGPGTGKTTLVNAILLMIRYLNRHRELKIHLCAPTGRAAKRLEETTQFPASTIHRLLHYTQQERKFEYHQNNLLEGDLFIVDECSMIDLPLFYALLNAISFDAKLVFVGDANQLPSVGAGYVLNDMIASQILPVIRLQQVFRQEKGSLIKENAHRIQQGQMPAKTYDSNDLSDFYFIESEEVESIQEIILKLYFQRIPSRFGLEAGEDIQIISPMNRGLIGVMELNQRVQDAMNKSESPHLIGSRAFKKMDRVMQIRNNYQKNRYNGDIGRVEDINEDDQKITVMFESQAIEYSAQDIDELQLAYAITIHKSQGSEFPAVIIPVHTQHYVMLQRNLMYTAMTRARKLVVMVGSRKALGMAIRNTQTANRYTYLQQRLVQRSKEMGLFNQD